MLKKKKKWTFNGLGGIEFPDTIWKFWFRPQVVTKKIAKPITKWITTHIVPTIKISSK
jgi:hypothetical protein